MNKLLQKFNSTVLPDEFYNAIENIKKTLIRHRRNPRIHVCISIPLSNYQQVIRQLYIIFENEYYISLSTLYNNGTAHIVFISKEVIITEAVQTVDEFIVSYLKRVRPNVQTTPEV